MAAAETAAKISQAEIAHLEAELREFTSALGEARRGAAHSAALAVRRASAVRDASDGSATAARRHQEALLQVRDEHTAVLVACQREASEARQLFEQS